MKTTINRWTGPGPEPPICRNCGQWKHNGRCLNDCQKRGFDPPSVGESVRVVRGISDTEKELAKHPDRIYVVDRYTKPHGFAVIRDEYGAWHVHPEALELLS